jgi:hypothetical protein
LLVWLNVERHPHFARPYQEPSRCRGAANDQEWHQIFNVHV